MTESHSPFTDLHKVRDLEAMTCSSGTTLCKPRYSQASFLPSSPSRSPSIPQPFDSPFSSQQEQQGLLRLPCNHHSPIAVVCGQITTTPGGDFHVCMTTNDLQVREVLKLLLAQLLASKAQLKQQRLYLAEPDLRCY